MASLATAAAPGKDHQNRSTNNTISYGSGEAASTASTASTASSISIERDEYCLDLAVEGENFCKAGKIREGIDKLQEALQVGPSDVTIEAAILSQLGNAYYFLGDYQQALAYHERDLAISRALNDLRAEAKSSGNTGNTLKSLGNYAAAIKSCERQLEIGEALNDSRIRSRALYNLGNVYHVEGKLLAKTSNERMGKLSYTASETLRKAVGYYETCLDLLKQLNDVQGQGRVLGNMGNTLFFLGDYAKSLIYHQHRLVLAHECQDPSAERRAYNNLGNCYIALGQYQVACEQYLQGLALAERIQDETVIAQICFCLGNVYTLLDNFQQAASYYERHLAIARSLGDLHGQQRALYSLANTWAGLNDHERADRYCDECLELSQQLGLSTTTPGGSGFGALARNSVPFGTSAVVSSGAANNTIHSQNSGTLVGSTLTSTRTIPATSSSSKLSTPVQQTATAGTNKRESMQKLQLIRLTPQERKKCKEENATACSSSSSAALAHNNQPLDDGFFALLERVQGSRIDDQRVELSSNQAAALTLTTKDMSSGVEAPPVAGPSSSFRRNSATTATTADSVMLEDDLFNQIHRAQARTIDSQRCDLNAIASRRESVDIIGDLSSRAVGTTTYKRSASTQPVAAGSSSSSMWPGKARAVSIAVPPETVPSTSNSVMQPPPPRSELSDDFFALLHRVQGSRLNDQRVAFIPQQQSINEEDDADEKRSIVGGGAGGSVDVAPTLPHDDFFALIDRIQSSRIDDQRCDPSILK